MSSTDLGARLERLTETLTAPDFLANRGIGNEIGFYIFAYDPQDEPVVSAFLPRLVERLRGPEHRLEMIVLDLYQLILELLESRGLLEKTFELEAKKGVAGVDKALRRIVRPETIVNLISERLTENLQLILVTGVGAAYPLIRSHTILNNLHAVVGDTPLVMFFPGSYDGQELRLFNLLKDDNYYRAFPLLESR